MLRYLLALNRKIQRKAGRDLVLAVLVALFFAVLLLLGLFVAREIFMLSAITVGMVALIELTSAIRRYGLAVYPLPLAVCMLLLPIAAYYLPAVWFWVVVLAAVAAVALVQLLLLPRALLVAVLILLYLPLTLSLAVLIIVGDKGPWWLLLMLSTVVAADTFSYVFGVAFGKHLLAPRISPKKTWEGFFGGLSGALIVGVLVAMLALGKSFLFGLLAAASLFIVAAAGDLLESLVKRRLGVKDMSSVLPGHGGMLDRIDSMLPAAALTFLLAQLQGWLQI